MEVEMSERGDWEKIDNLGCDASKSDALGTCLHVHIINNLNLYQGTKFSFMLTSRLNMNKTTETSCANKIYVFP